MRKWKLAVAATGASGVLALGLFAAFTLTAKAGTVSGTGCTVTGTGTETKPIFCTATDTAAAGTALAFPISVTLTAFTSNATDTGGDASLPVTFAWTSSCTEPSGQKVPASGTSAGTVSTSAPTPVLTLSASTNMGAIDPTTCDLTTLVTVDSTADGLKATDLNVQVEVNQSAAANPTASPTPSAATSSASPPSVKRYNNQVRGFDGICLDDKGNKSAERTAVIVWTCNNTDQAQGWTYSGSELKIHGMCLNAKGSGKSGSKLILWSCGGSGNEIFSHRSNGEFVEKANGYTMCIDDPGYSTKNGAQPIMYKCNNGANQHWAKP
jgi:hypothetical protein